MEIEQKLQRTIDTFKQDLKTLRVGRASASLVEDIAVDIYESKISLNQVASISIPQHNQILIQPWDVGNLSAVQNAIKNSEIQIEPVIEGNTIRLTLPPLTEETRQELAKDISKYAENVRIAIRHIREEGMRELEKKEKTKKISEDDKFREEKEIQKLVDKFNDKIKEIQENKEKEILEN